MADRGARDVARDARPAIAQLSSIVRVLHDVRRTVILAALLLIVGTPAGASADWSAPERVSPGPLVAQPTLAFTRAGAAVSTWYMLQGEYTHNPGSVSG